MCGHVRGVETRTRFVILMHPKEFKKIKNGTGHLTRLSLPNSELHIGVDFSSHTRVNALIADPENHCMLLYPGDESLCLNERSISVQGKANVVFVLDATWDCSKTMLKVSHNLARLQRISFHATKRSAFEIKQQPEAYCLSTIESVQTVMELMTLQGDETIDAEALEDFLNPFKAMIAYQKSCIAEDGVGFRNSVRYKKPLSKL
jgi:DTW domain-containing protein YfiP